jgi:ParB-like chromosome segregation protein Spo0J
MQQINVNELKEHPMNSYLFDDIVGENWDAFLESIKTSGVIEPIIATQDKVLVSGHQRVRGCKELDITTIPCDIRIYDTDDKLLKDLIETNLRQRGLGNTNPIKMGRCIKELERIYGIRQGQYGRNPNNSEISSQTELASMVGISVDTLNNYKKLTDLIPDLSDLVDTGIVTPTTALSIVKNMSPNEQEQFVESMDITKKITQKQAQQYIERIKQLESIPPKIKEIEIDKTDYAVADKNKKLLSDIDNLKIEISKLSSINKTLEESSKTSDRIAKSYKELSDDYKKQSEEYTAVKNKIIDMGLEPDGDYNLYSAASEVAKLSKEIEDLLLNKLAPMKYQSFMIAVKNSDVMKKNFINTLSMVKEWYESMMNYVNENNEYESYDIVDMEEN